MLNEGHATVYEELQTTAVSLSMRIISFLYYILFFFQKDRENVLDLAQPRQASMKKLSWFINKGSFQKKKATTISSTNVNQSNKLKLTESLKGA